MKYLRLVLCLSLFAFATNSSFALSDAPQPDKSVRILVAKSDDVTAKVTIESQTYLVPVQFEDNSFSWNDVKDGYSITPGFASLIEHGRVYIYIGCSGASFHATKGHSRK